MPFAIQPVVMATLTVVWTYGGETFYFYDVKAILQKMSAI